MIICIVECVWNSFHDSLGLPAHPLNLTLSIFLVIHLSIRLGWWRMLHVLRTHHTRVGFESLFADRTLFSCLLTIQATMKTNMFYSLLRLVNRGIHSIPWKFVGDLPDLILRFKLSILNFKHTFVCGIVDSFEGAERLLYSIIQNIDLALVISQIVVEIYKVVFVLIQIWSVILLSLLDDFCRIDWNIMIIINLFLISVPHLFLISLGIYFFGRLLVG